MRTLPPLLFLALGLSACDDKSSDDGSGDDGGTLFGDGTGGDGTGSDDTGGGGTDTDDQDGDGYALEDDCDDNNAEIHPFADEYCDGVDNDCDGDTDEDSALDAVTWYQDEDGDGYGTNDERDTACAQPEGYVSQGGDCDDGDADFNPGAPEEDCTDPTDWNCDGEVAWADEDEDGWAACEDCADEDAEINPDASEICDGSDNDCDGLTDDADDSVDQTTRKQYYPDDDADGYGDLSAAPTTACTQPTGMVADRTDCDDDATDVNPGATEVCDASKTDEDCNGLADDADSGVDSSTLSEFFVDADKDGYGAGLPSYYCVDPSTAAAKWSTTDSDCDDTTKAVNPGATEICDSSNTDEDCNGVADDDDSGVSAATMTAWYLDADEDGYGSTGAPVTACDDPSTAVLTYGTGNSDCDDTDSSINPGATEICDASDTDEDCNGVADDDDSGTSSASMTSWYLDADLDGYGDASNTQLLCEDPSTGAADWITDDTDCDDDNEDINPGETEICDELDNDCDASTTASAAVTYTSTGGTITDVTTTYTAGTTTTPASSTLSSGTYEFCGGTFYVTLTVPATTTTISGLNGAVLSGADKKVVISATGAAKLTLQDIVIEAGYGTSTAGAISHASSSGTLTLDGVTVQDSIGYYGGGIYSAAALTMTDSLIDNNQVWYYGGGLYLSKSATITNSTISNNYADYYGGGLYLSSGTTTLTDTTLSYNTAYAYGGGAYVKQSSLSCSISTGGAGGFVANSTLYGGGGVYFYPTSKTSSERITSTACDWGTGAARQNNPTDISLSTITTTYSSYGSSATFTCSGAGCY